MIILIINIIKSIYNSFLFSKSSKKIKNGIFRLIAKLAKKDKEL